MATYTIVSPKHRDAGFSRYHRRRFGSEEQAQQWIEADQAREAQQRAAD
jgi:hypothetical protein